MFVRDAEVILSYGMSLLSRVANPVKGLGIFLFHPAQLHHAAEVALSCSVSFFDSH
jgi:hypothetical protein